MISLAIVIMMSLVFILSPYLTMIFTKFLQELPLQKQSLLTRLCQDVSWVNLLFVWLWAIISMVFKAFEETGNDHLIKSISYYVTLIAEILFFMMILYLYLIGSLKAYTTRYHVLDPIEEWSGRSETYSVRITRLAIVTMGILELGCLLLCNIKPLTYYKLNKCELNEKPVPWNTILLLYVDCGLLTACILSILAGYYVQHLEDSKLKRYCVDIEIQNVNQTINLDLNIQENDENRNELVDSQSNNDQQSVVKQVSFPSLIYLANGTLIPLIFLLHHFNVISLNFWWIITLSIGLEGVGIPVALILRYPSLRNYCLRKVRHHKEYIFLAIRRVSSCFRQHSSTVASIS